MVRSAVSWPNRSGLACRCVIMSGPVSPRPATRDRPRHRRLVRRRVDDGEAFGLAAARAGGSRRGPARDSRWPLASKRAMAPRAAQRAMPTSTGRSSTRVRSGRCAPSSGACRASTSSRPRPPATALIDAAWNRRSGRTAPSGRDPERAGSRGGDGRRGRRGTGRARRSGRQRSGGPWTISSRIASAPSVPPGSRVSRQLDAALAQVGSRDGAAACSCPPPRRPRR